MTAKPNRVHATFDGLPIEAEPGASVAAALLNSDEVAWRTTRGGKPRGLFCGIGICFDCLVEIDGQSGQRACMIPLAEGMDVRPATRSVADDADGAAGVAPVESADPRTGGGCCGGGSCGASEESSS
jgi:predicted molibdopterin-dependent oxidoreductase YjgC